jgi:hypothetical protein
VLHGERVIVWESMVRDYCYLINSRIRDRNCGCRRHDNAYGINGGGGEVDRWVADAALYRHMRAQKDPLAIPIRLACLFWGWIFFNYHPGRWLWTGQLIRRFRKGPQ